MRRIVFAGLLAFAGVSANCMPASAATLDDVMARLDSLQRDNQAMRKEIATLRQRDQRLPDVRQAGTPQGRTLDVAPTPAASSTPAAPMNAMAADYTKAPLYAGAYNWTGVYAGLNAGYAFGHDTTNSPDLGTATTDFKGFAGGGQIGFNLQYDALVLGIEADAQFASIGGSASTLSLATPGLFLSTNSNNKVDAFGTVRGRIGYAFDRALIYGTGGFAAAHNMGTSTFQQQIGPNPPLVTATFTDSAVHTGWTAGGGLEYGFRDGWSVKAEYLHLAFGNKLYPGLVSSAEFKFDLVRAGVNYRF